LELITNIQLKIELMQEDIHSIDWVYFHAGIKIRVEINLCKSVKSVDKCFSMIFKHKKIGQLIAALFFVQHL